MNKQMRTAKYLTAWAKRGGDAAALATGQRLQADARTQANQASETTKPMRASDILLEPNK